MLNEARRGLIYNNLLAIFLVFFATFLNGKPIPFIGNMVWLQIGVILLMYLLMTHRVFLGCFLGVQVSAVWLWNWEVFLFSNFIIVFISTISPLIAISLMKFFKLSSFFDSGKLVFQHLIFLAIFTAICNTFLKFLSYSYFEADPSNLSFDALLFIERYFLGDLFGCLFVLFFATSIVVPFIKFLLPKLAPSKSV